MAAAGRAARTLTACGLAAALLLPAGGAAAWAGYDSSVPASTAVSTGTVAAPTGATATATCKGKTGNGKGGGAGGSGTGSFVTVSWKASASPFVAAYNILRSANGAPPALVAVGVSGTTWSDTAIVGTTTYAYTVQAVYRSWTKDSATPATVTTTNACG